MKLIKSKDLHVRQKALMIYYAWVKTQKEYMINNIERLSF